MAKNKPTNTAPATTARGQRAPKGVLRRLLRTLHRAVKRFPYWMIPPSYYTRRFTRDLARLDADASPRAGASTFFWRAWA